MCNELELIDKYSVTISAVTETDFSKFRFALLGWIYAVLLYSLLGPY